MLTIADDVPVPQLRELAGHLFANRPGGPLWPPNAKQFELDIWRSMAEGVLDAIGDKGVARSLGYRVVGTGETTYEALARCLGLEMS